MECLKRMGLLHDGSGDMSFSLLKRPGFGCQTRGCILQTGLMLDFFCFAFTFCVLFHFLSWFADLALIFEDTD